MLNAHYNFAKQKTLLVEIIKNKAKQKEMGISRKIDSFVSLGLIICRRNNNNNNWRRGGSKRKDTLYRVHLDLSWRKTRSECHDNISRHKQQFVQLEISVWKHTHTHTHMSPVTYIYVHNSFLPVSSHNLPFPTNTSPFFPSFIRNGCCARFNHIA